MCYDKACTCGDPSRTPTTWLKIRTPITSSYYRHLLDELINGRAHSDRLVPVYPEDVRQIGSNRSASFGPQTRSNNGRNGLRGRRLY